MNTPVRLKGAPNFRDFGGHATTDGRRVKRSKLFRSEALHALPQEDHALLAELDIRLVCDLRSDLERSRRPAHWPVPLAPTLLHMEVNVDLRAESCELSDMLRADPSAHGAHRMMLHAYRYIPDGLLRHLGKFFEAATSAEPAAEPVAVLLHCSAGKDRTGVFAALLLLLLGVKRESVLADYLATNQCDIIDRLEAALGQLLETVLGQTPAPEVVKLVAGVREIYLETALDAISARYGSIEDYLACAGVNREQIQKFRSRLIE
ncbi:MAG: tyrosine-protein phosphatase [Sterolibacterium sp.]